MADDVTPQGSGEGAAAPITDERSAASAIEGLLGSLDDDAGDDTPSGADAAQDAGSDESSTTGEDDGHSETPAAASIEPPKSWSAEDKALFSKLPPDAQAVVARRESERDAHFTRQSQEIANERQGFEAERQAIATQRTQYLQSLQQLVQLALPEAKAFEGVDWAKLAAENPAEYVRLNGLRDQLRGRVGALDAEMRRVAGEQQKAQQQQFQRQRGEQQQLLVAKVPEFGDAEKAPKLIGELRSFLDREGFNDAEIGSAIDHRLISLAVKAMRAEQAEAARASAATKTANKAPQVQRSGSQPDRGDAASRRMRDKVGQLGRSGSVRDAASLLMEVL